MITEKDGNILLDVHVIPRSSVNKIELLEETLRLKITAPPVDGEANKAVIEFLSDYLDIPKRTINIEKGETSKNKRIRIEGFSSPKLLEKINKK